MHRNVFNVTRTIICDQACWKTAFFTGGIWNKEDPLKRVLPFALIRLAMFFAVSKILRNLLKPLKQTKFFCNLLAGVILGTSVLGVFKNYASLENMPSHWQFVNLIAFYGVLYYTFLIAVKIDDTRILRIGKKAYIIGFVASLGSFISMVILNHFLHPPTFKQPGQDYYFYFQASCTSLLNIAPALEDFQLLTTEVGQIALSSGLANDVLTSILWLVAVLRKSCERKIYFLKVIPAICFLFLVTLFVFRPIMQLIARTTPKGHRVKETYVLGVILMAGLMAVSFDVIAGSPFYGIMLFGLVVPNGPPLGSAVVDMGEMFIENLLQPFFFLSIGDMLDLCHIINWKGQLLFLLIMAVGYFIRALLTTLLGMAFNMSYQQAIALGLTVNATGIADIGLPWFSWLRQTMDVTFATVVTLSGLVKGALVTPLALHFHKRKSSYSIRGFELSLQAVSTNSKMQLLACVYHEDDVPGIITLFEASNPTENHPINAFVIHVNELIGEALPILAPHKKHQRICSHNGCHQITSALKNYTENSSGKVNLNLITMVAPFKGMHEGLSKLALDKMAPLMIVPFSYKDPTTHYINQSLSSDLNRRIQAHAPCTVGILVDRSSQRIKQQSQNNSSFSIKVGVIFFGGEDDREVLALASRMSNHPGVGLMVLRILLKDYQLVMDDENKIFDDEIVEGFKAKISNNACAVLREVEIDTWVNALRLIRTVVNEECDYDLVMVGRRHGEPEVDEQDMSVLFGAPELGFIGETIASMELTNTSSSILVLQHGFGVDRDALGNLMTMEGDH